MLNEDFMRLDCFCSHLRPHCTSQSFALEIRSREFPGQAAYLLSPPATQKAHEAKEAALPKHKIPDPAHAPVPAGEDESTPSKPETDQAAEARPGFYSSVIYHALTIIRASPMTRAPKSQPRKLLTL